MATTVKPQRPLGVTILGGLVFLAGIVFLVLAVLNLLVFFGTLAIEVPGEASDELLVATLTGFALAIALLASGNGLLKLRPWAWWLAFVVVLLVVVRALFVFVARLHEAVLTALLSGAVGLVLGLVILGYIVAVKRHFR